MTHRARFPITGFLRGRHTSAWFVSVVLLCMLAIPLAILAFRSAGLDFRAFYVAAKAASAHLDPYVDNGRLGEQFADGTTANGGSRWIYPPTALFFTSPAGLFSFPTAKLLFGLASVAAVIGTLLFLGRRFAISPLWLAITCVSLPVIACVQRGQVDLLILLCVVLAYRFLGRCWAGIPLGIAICIKVFPAALLLWWLLEKRFKETATAIAFTLLLGLLAAWRFDLASYASFLHNLTTLHAASSSATQPASGFGHLALPDFAGPWLSFSPGFVGSYNNPLILLGNGGMLAGFALTVLAAFLLRFRRVGTEIGFFSMALLSQLMNTALWTMGMVMYIPICLIFLSRMRSRMAAFFLLVPLYLPSQIRVFGITPRFLVALLLMAWLIAKSEPHDSFAPRSAPPEASEATL